MKLLKSLLAIALMLCMMLTLCACGNQNSKEDPAEPQNDASSAETPENDAAEDAAPENVPETDVPADNAAEEEPVVEDNGNLNYSITVQDENGTPIAGAMVQMCLETCYPGATDENGVAKFSLAEAEYKVSFLVLPEGYTYVDDVQEFYFEDGATELTITLKQA